MQLKVGKLDNDTLQRVILDKITYKSPQVLVKAGVGEDCAHLDFGEDCCVLSTDPITASVQEIGRLAIHVSCNDVAATGVRPFAILLALMLPVGSTLEDVETIMAQAAAEAGAMQVEIAGGHTEVTPAVSTPVIVATAIGRAPKGRILAREGILPGDKLLVTKTVGLEGSAILATDYAERLRGILSEEEIAEARAYTERTDVLTEGAVSGEVGVSAMHDVTEGGILGAIWELCTVARTGAVVYEESIPVTDLTRKICAALGVDWRRLISSGAMLIVCRPEKEGRLRDGLAVAGVVATCIGEMRQGEEGIMLCHGEEAFPILPPESDEIYRVVGK